MSTTLTVNQTDVLKEVARKTAYAGGKLQETPKAQDPEALDRIATIDEDDPELKTFWDECRAEVVRVLSPKVVSEGFEEVSPDDYHLTLNLWDGFNTALVPSMEIALFNYFVYGIIGRWYMYTHKEEAAAYMTMAAGYLEDLNSSTLKRTFDRVMYPY